MVSRLAGFAGPAAFQRRFAGELAGYGIEVCYNLDEEPCDAVLVIGGTRNLAGLRAARKRGIPVYQRLNGMNWIHRRRRTGIRHYLKAEISNLLLRFIRSRLADGVIYQSRFARDWWERVAGKTPVPSTVIHNAVPLDRYTPAGTANRPVDHERILIVEGNLAGGYDFGLKAAFALVQSLRTVHHRNVQLVVAGNAPEALRRRWQSASDVPVSWLGAVSPEAIPALDRSAHLLYSSDIHPACPNSVIEALACGLPVAAFDTGSLDELVGKKAGRIVSYGGDPWLLDDPDTEGLAAAALEILDNQEVFRSAARKRALEAFDLSTRTADYLKFLGLL